MSMNLTPASLAVAHTYGLARPPRPIWLGNSTTLRAYIGHAGPLRYLKR